MPVSHKPALDRSDVGSRRWVLVALMCTMMMAAMDITIVSTAIPQIVGDLGGFRLFSWVFSIYLLAQTVTIPIYGKLSDLVGRKPVLIGGTLVFLAGSVACSLAWDMPALIVFRGVQGLGAGAVMATVATLAGDLYSIRERAKVQGWLSSVWGIAALAGPLLGGAFADYVSWHWIFLVNVPIGAVALILIWLFLHESFERREPKIDYAGSVLVLITVGLVIFGLLQGGLAWDWLSWQSLSVFGTASALLWLLVWVEQRAPEPVIPGWLWRNRVLGWGNVAGICMGLVMMAPSAYLPTFLQSVHGLGAIAAGMVLASISIGWPVASTFSGHLYLRIGFRDTALIGGVLLLVASICFVLLPAPRPVWAMVPVLVLLGAGFGLLSTPLMVGLQSVVGWEQRGVVTSAHMFSRYLGQSVGAAIFGAIFNMMITRRLEDAPAALHDGLPETVDLVIDVLRAGEAGAAAEAYLRDAITFATRGLFSGMALFALGLIVALLMMPRRFRMLREDGTVGPKDAIPVAVAGADQ